MCHDPNPRPNPRSPPPSASHASAGCGARPLQRQSLVRVGARHLCDAPRFVGAIHSQTQAIDRPDDKRRFAHNWLVVVSPGRNEKTTRRWLSGFAIASATNAIFDQLFQLVKRFFHNIPASTSLAISAALAVPTRIARSLTSDGSRKLYQTGLPVTKLRASICNAVLCSGGNSFT